MIGRKKETALLEELYANRKFEFLVLYGRRRVGKTTLLNHFSKQHKCLFYSAQEKNDALNLSDFSSAIQIFFTGKTITPFQTWEQALDFIDDTAKDSDRTVIIIDEFPFIAKQNPSIKSILQHRIDHRWKDHNIMLILCGSSVSFMLNDVMGYESPLYGRATAKLELKPFDYRESSEFFPAFSDEQKAIAYGILGGIPRYLQEFDDSENIQENIRKRIVRNSSFLNDEPAALLKMELRETNVYSSILEAVSQGHNRIHEIADHIHEEPAKVSKYIATLATLRLIEKVTPCGEPANSRKAIYQITDNYFRFWYRYIFSNRSYYELLGEEEASAAIMDNIYDFMGPAFEEICSQYLKHAAKRRQLPFVPFYIGKWWGNNPVLKAQDDVDILCLSKDKTQALFCECKFKNRPMPMEEYEDLVAATAAFPKVTKKHLLFFSKSGYTEPVRKRAEAENSRLLTLQDLYGR